MPFKTYLINKINDNKFRVNGLVPSTRLPHKKHLCQSFRHQILYSPDQLPPKVDLRPEMTPIENQSQIGSCSANCLAGAYEYLTKKSNGLDIDVSRLFIYYNGRVKENNSQTVTDSGCSMTCAIEALEESGTCLETIWPYDISRVNIRPNDQAYQQAASHKITGAFRINIDLHEMKACLAQGFPFAFGLRLFSSFDKAAQTGVVPMPNTEDSSRQSDGSHALLAVGYSDQSQAFIVRNSWGEDWGDKGYCYIPYGYLTNSDLSFDIWTIRTLNNNDFGQGHWHFNDSVNYLSHHHHGHHQNRFSNDNDDDNSRTIEGYDEDDDDNGYAGNGRNQNSGWNDNSRQDGFNDNTDPYQNDQRNDYSGNDPDYYGNQNRYDQDDNRFGDDGFNSNRDFSNSNYDQNRYDNNRYGDY